MNIVFMGTPEFAVPSLEILLNAGYNIVGVITSTDKLGGRGRKTLIESAVKTFAVSKGLRVLQPKNLKSPRFNDDLRALNADLQVVVAFRMLPEMVWNMPKLGTINLHGSLLPKYRGAAPINWAVINGDRETGVTTFKLKHAIDTGDIILQKKMHIFPTDTAGDVHDRMKYLGAEAVLETVQLIESGDVSYSNQDETKVSKAPKIYREITQIDFNNKAVSIYNFIRGLSPHPGAWFALSSGQNIKVYKSEYEICTTGKSPGHLLSDQKNHIKIAARDGYIYLVELQITGKRKLPVREFLNGNEINEEIIGFLK